MAIHHLFSLFIKMVAFSHKQQYLYDESKDEMYFIDFFHPNFFIVCTNVTCNLSNTIIKILVVNVICD
jgi:hypothetical protein